MKKNLYQVIQSNNKGYIALVTVLILSLVASLIFVTAMVINTDSAISSSNLTEGTIARYHAESCIDVAINYLKNNLNYTGNESITQNDINCNIGSISQSSGVYIIPTSSSFGNFEYMIETRVSEISPNTVIDSIDRAL